jgi:hypothetical protein
LLDDQCICQPIADPLVVGQIDRGERNKIHAREHINTSRVVWDATVLLSIVGSLSLAWELHLIEQFFQVSMTLVWFFVFLPKTVKQRHLSQKGEIVLCKIESIYVARQLRFTFFIQRL